MINPTSKGPVPMPTPKKQDQDQNGNIKIEVKWAELNNPDEHPKQWNLQRNLENDLAIRIGHGEIKEYCKKMRDKKAN
jgi:hypothetical protein